MQILEKHFAERTSLDPLDILRCVGSLRDCSDERHDSCSSSQPDRAYDRRLYIRLLPQSWPTQSSPESRAT